MSGPGVSARPAAAVVLMLVLAGPAAAGNKRILTPRVFPPTTGSLTCTVLNASDKKSAEVIIFVKDHDGNIVEPPGQPTLTPGDSALAFSSQDDAAYCEVEILKGNRKDLRVAVIVRDSGGSMLSALPGY